MTLDPAQAWDLVETAAAGDRQLLVPYGWHYKPFVQRAKALMDEGAVGRVEYALCHMASPTKGFFAGGGKPPDRWEATIAEPDPGTWQLPERGGGYAHGQITHSSALLLWLTGLRASRVTALMTRPSSRVDMYDAAAVAFEGGAIGTVSGAATLPDNDPFQVDLRIFGSDGVLLLDVERERMEVRRHDGGHIVEAVPAGQGAYSCEVPPVRFVELIKGEGRNDSPGEVAARSVELIDAMHRSAAADGAPVDVWRAVR
jgi:predicted dehydrogenase